MAYWLKHWTADWKVPGPVPFSLVPRPHPLVRNGVWWPLSDFLVVWSQQSAISYVTWVAQQRWGWSLSTRLQIGRIGWSSMSTWLHDVALFQYQECWLAQPRNRSMVTRPLSSWEGGSGHETMFHLQQWFCDKARYGEDQWDCEIYYYVVLSLKQQKSYLCIWLSEHIWAAVSLNVARLR